VFIPFVRVDRWIETNRLLSHNTLCRWGLGASGLLHGEGVRVPGGLLLGGSRVLGGFEEVEEAHFVIDIWFVRESRDGIRVTVRMKMRCGEIGAS
jgi:hypothetical protein